METTTLGRYVLRELISLADCLGRHGHAGEVELMAELQVEPELRCGGGRQAARRLQPLK